MGGLADESRARAHHPPRLNHQRAAIDARAYPSPAWVRRCCRWWWRARRRRSAVT